MTAIQIADSFDSFAIDHTPDGWPAVQQKQLTEAAAELRRLEAQLQKETAARQAAQIEAEALKERLVRADAEKCAAVLAERIAPKAPMQDPVHKLIYPGGGKALFDRLWHLTCNAVATQSGMRVRTNVLPMQEMKEFLDHLCVLVDSPPQPVPAPVQEQQPVAWACLFTDDGSLCQTFDTQKEADKWVESDDNLWDVYVAPLYTVQPRKADGCNWPICQTEQYQQDLADQIAKELIGEPRKAVKLSDSEG